MLENSLVLFVLKFMQITQRYSFYFIAINATSASSDLKYVHNEGQAGKKIEPSPFISHTDLELVLIEGLVSCSLPYMPGDAYDGSLRSY